MSPPPEPFCCQECHQSFRTMPAFRTHAVRQHTDHVTYMIAWCYLDAATFASWSFDRYAETKEIVG